MNNQFKLVQPYLYKPISSNFFKNLFCIKKVYLRKIHIRKGYVTCKQVSMAVLLEQYISKDHFNTSSGTEMPFTKLFYKRKTTFLGCNTKMMKLSYDYNSYNHIVHIENVCHI